jgi:hypothetical protein
MELKKYPMTPSTVIHLPFKYDMTGKELAAPDNHARASVTIYEYRNLNLATHLQEADGWWKDIPWDHVISNCLKALNLVEKLIAVFREAFETGVLVHVR